MVHFLSVCHPRRVLKRLCGLACSACCCIIAEQWKDYKSTSTNFAAAAEFAKKDEDHPEPVFFIIVGARANLGAKFSTKPPLSAWPNEDEILLPAGATFVVKKRQYIGGQEGTEEYKGIRVTLKYLGEWWEPRRGRLAQMRERLTSCRKQGETLGRKYRQDAAHGQRLRYAAPEPEPEPEPETASKPQLELLGLEGNQAAASANVLNDQVGVPFAALAPKDYFAQAALQQVQKQRQTQRLRETDPLCFELVAEQGMAELDFEGVRALVSDWFQTVINGRPAVTMTLDDAIGAWLWISKHKIDHVDTPSEEFKQLYYHLGNAVRAIPGVEEGQGGEEGTLYRGKAYLTPGEDRAYRPDMTVRWADFRFVFARQEAATSDAGANGFVCVLRRVRANLGAFFGRTDPPLSHAVAPDELLLPSGVTFRVMERRRNERTGLTTIVLEYAGDDAQGDDGAWGHVHVLETTLSLPGQDDDRAEKRSSKARTTMRKLRVARMMGGAGALARLAAAGHSEQQPSPDQQPPSPLPGVVEAT
jgi:hypothetical protein